MFSSYHISSDYCCLLLAEFNFRWNERRCIETGFRMDYGHFDYSLIEEIAVLEDSLGIESKFYDQFARITDYEETTETYVS